MWRAYKRGRIVGPILMFLTILWILLFVILCWLFTYGCTVVIRVYSYSPPHLLWLLFTLCNESKWVYELMGSNSLFYTELLLKPQVIWILFLVRQIKNYTCSTETNVLLKVICYLVGIIKVFLMLLTIFFFSFLMKNFRTAEMMIREKQVYFLCRWP